MHDLNIYLEAMHDLNIYLDTMHDLPRQIIESRGARP